MRPDIQEKSKIKVIDKTSSYYRWRGTVSQLIMQPSLIDPEKEDVVGFVCTVHPLESEMAEIVEFKPEQVACIQKKFIDIEHIRENEVELGNGVVRRANTGAFEPGDIIHISEKIDGANASIAYNEDEHTLEIFSRTNLLSGADGLRGFKPYIETKFKPDEFKAFPDLVIFGEWCVRHSVVYASGWENKWRVYDIWDKSKKNYLPQTEVKKFCEEHGIIYANVLYEGPFISWDHCRSFMHKNTYGDKQEGIVVKNQTKLDRNDIREPKYLKIVNDEFKESMVQKEKKPVDPEKVKAYEALREKTRQIVTEARVKKLVMKLIDEQLLPKELTPKCMGTVCKYIPKAVYEDCLKEEPEVMALLGADAGKLCSQEAIQICRQLVIGK